MRLPDPQRSQAVLIGTSTYVDSGLTDLPQVEANVTDLAKTLTDPDHGSLLTPNCSVILNEPNQRTVGHELLRAAEEAEDLLLLYYSGHGLIGPRKGELYLTLTETEQDAPGFTALLFDLVRHAFLDSRAAAKVLILDCCYSGRAISIHTLGANATAILGQVAIQGTYTLTSATGNEPSIALEGEPHTAFTGRLIRLLREGRASGSPLLTLGELYWYLQTELTAEGLPVPQQCGTATADLLALVRNRRWEPGQRAEIQTKKITPSIAYSPGPVTMPVLGHGESIAAAGGRHLEVAIEQELAFGREHPDSLAARSRLADWKGRVGDIFGAREELTRLTAACAQALGDKHSVTVEAKLSLAHWTGEAGARSTARDQFRAIVKARDDSKDPTNADTFAALEGMAHWTGMAGDPRTAQRQLGPLARACEKALGPGHPQTLATRSDLAEWTGEAGNATSARSQLTELIPVCERVLGPEHPDTLIAERRQAHWTGVAGNWSQAYSQLTELIPVCERTLGAEHPHTLLTKRLGAVAAAQTAVRDDQPDRHQAAVVQLTEIVSTFERVLGPHHPCTLDASSDLALRVDNKEQALDLITGVLPACARILGPGHVMTLDAGLILAEIEGRELGDTQSSWHQLAKIISRYKETLGAEHPKTLNAMWTRSKLFSKHSQYMIFQDHSCFPFRARDEYAEFIPVHERVCGAEHPNTLLMRLEYAEIVRDQNKGEQARDLYYNLLPLFARTFGVDHRYTLTVHRRYTSQIAEYDTPEASRRQYATLARAIEESRGAEHPDTLAARADVAFRTGRTGDHQGARDQLIELLPLYERVLGAEAPETLLARVDIAEWDGYAGNPRAAREALAELVPRLERSQGADDISTLTARRALALWTGEVGSRRAARRQYSRLVRDYERILGPDHDETESARSDLNQFKNKE